MVNTSTESTMSLQTWGYQPSIVPTEDEWRHAIRAISSLEFDVSVNVVSGLRLVLKAINRREATKILLSAIRTSGMAQEEVLNLISDLTQEKIDMRYLNPNDTALTVLLWLTMSGSPDHAEYAAIAVDQAPQTWNAKKLARFVISPPPNPSSDNYQETVDPQIVNTGSGEVPINFVSHSEDHIRPISIGAGDSGP